MVPCPRRLAGPLAAAGALGILFSAGSARAQAVLAPTATFTGSFFHYTYSVTSLVQTGDLALVTLSGLPLDPGAATNLMAPTGFQTTFGTDTNSGYVDFSPTTAAPGDPQSAFVAGTPVTGFSFDSIFAPTSVSYDALDSAGNDVAGMTLGPAGAPVPEASTLVSLGAGLSVLTFAVLRRRRTAAAAL